MILTEPRPTVAPVPPPRLTSYRYWEGYQAELLQQVHKTLKRVITDKEAQFDLFAIPQEAPVAAPLEQPPDKNVTLGRVLSPSQVKQFLDCSARWWFKYGAGLPDPKGGSLVRGLAVHKVVEHWYRERARESAIEIDDLAEFYDHAWDALAEEAAFAKDEDPEELKRQGAMLLRKYLEEAAPEIDPIELELHVEGEIAGVPVRGIIDMIERDGTITDLKTASKKPSGLDGGYRFQLATYRQIAPIGLVSGKARLDTLVSTKTPQLVKIEHTVTNADVLLTQKLYPLVREGMREGLYFPNRGSNLCSRKYCNFCDACVKEFGGDV